MQRAGSRPCRQRSAALLSVATLLSGLSACGDDTAGPETGLAIQAIHEAFDSGEAESVAGVEATLSAKVNDLISPSAFTIGGAGLNDVEQLLVIAEDVPLPDQGDNVLVTGTVHRFDFTEVHDRLGVDMAQPLFDEYQGGPYVWAEEIADDVDF